VQVELGSDVQAMDLGLVRGLVRDRVRGLVVLAFLHQRTEPQPPRRQRQCRCCRAHPHCR
jgi:hypothetical protein